MVLGDDVEIGRRQTHKVEGVLVQIHLGFLSGGLIEPQSVEGYVDIRGIASRSEEGDLLSGQSVQSSREEEVMPALDGGHIVYVPFFVCLLGGQAVFEHIFNDLYLILGVVLHIRHSHTVIGGDILNGGVILACDKQHNKAHSDTGYII